MEQTKVVKDGESLMVNIGEFLSYGTFKDQSYWNIVHRFSEIRIFYCSCKNKTVKQNKIIKDVFQGTIHIKGSGWIDLREPAGLCTDTY